MFFCLFFSFLSSFLFYPFLSVFYVCVFLSSLLLVICVYDDEGREEYLWEIRQRGGGAAPSRLLMWGYAPYHNADTTHLPNI